MKRDVLFLLCLLLQFVAYHEYSATANEQRADDNFYKKLHSLSYILYM